MCLKNVLFILGISLISSANLMAGDDYKEDFIQFETTLDDVHRESAEISGDPDWSDLDLDDWDFDDAVVKYPFAAVEKRIPDNYFVKEINEKIEDQNIDRSEDLEISVNTIYATNVDSPDVRLGKRDTNHETGQVNHVNVGICLPQSYSPHL